MQLHFLHNKSGGRATYELKNCGLYINFLKLLNINK